MPCCMQKRRKDTTFLKIKQAHTLLYMGACLIFKII